MDQVEEGLGEWVSGAHAPPDPNNPGRTVAWNITRSTAVSKSGKYSLKFFLDERQDEEVIWVGRRISLSEGRIVRIRVSFELYR